MVRKDHSFLPNFYNNPRLHELKVYSKTSDVSSRSLQEQNLLLEKNICYKIHHP